jgi:hypothetical protein
MGMLPVLLSKSGADERGVAAGASGRYPAHQNTPTDAHKLAAELYERVGPMLSCHVLCREFALLVLGVAAGMGIEAELKCEATHFFVQFSDGSRSENYWQNVRLVPPP